MLNAGDTILKQTSDRIVQTSSEELKMMNIRRVYQYFENNIRNISDLLFILIGCYLYTKNLLTIPIFVILYNYQGKVKNLLTGIVKLLEYNKKFVVSANRVFEVISDEKFKKEHFGNKHLKKLEGKIKFDNVSFSYDEKTKIINKMNFEISPNETIAFVGKSGAGKTTIFSLITKLYNINSGKILLDDINIMTVILFVVICQ